MTDAIEGALEGPPTDAVSPTEGASEATENTTGQADGPPAEGAKAEPTETPEERERKSRNERRREQKERLIREARESEARAAQAEARLQAMRDAASKLSRPDPKNYTDLDLYQADLNAWALMSAEDKRQAQLIESHARAERERVEAARRAAAQEDAQNWATQAAEGRARYADFDQVALRDAPIDARMARVIVQSDQAADVAYWLGKNQDTARQIAGLDDLGLARAIGRIEAQLAAPKPPPPIPAAPPPITPVREKAAPSKSPETMSMDEYMKARKAGLIR